MAEKYKKHLKSKSNRDYRREETSRSKLNRRSDDYYAAESKTPPLPKRSTYSIEHLLKKRESLKEELKKMTKYSDSNIKNKYKSNKDYKKRKHSIDNSGHKVYPKKYCNNYEDNRKKYDIVKEASPEYTEDMQIESEDEENIIEQRRKQRKKLLEQLTTSHDKTWAEKNTVDINNDSSEHPGNIPFNLTKPIIKEETDMFSEKDDFRSQSTLNQILVSGNDNDTQLADNWDDAEGYYNIREGDIINNNRYTIKSLLGQGVFANVARAQDNNHGNSMVAIKIIRNNELMYKTSLKEVAILKEINDADPDSKYHCVQFMRSFMHRGHLCLVLESLHMDLRCVIKKYGKNHGINMKALMSYSRQLLMALRLLKKIGIVHADVKPDNILVNEKKNVLKLCDFGSAAKVDDNEPTPYLVSRFYRAPEIILGIPYKHGVDVWSTACTIYEMATGKILFTGNTNNKMLKCFMDYKGKIPSKLIRKGKFKDQHFNYNNNFLLHKKDDFTGRDKVVEVTNINATRDLSYEIKKSCRNSSSTEEKKLVQLKDLLDKMLMLDANQRFSSLECLKHPFIQEELQK